MKGRLVKWDAEMLAPIPRPWWKLAVRRVASRFGRDVFPLQHRVPASTDHPACIEVIELNEGQLPQTIYRRADHGTDDLGRTVSR